MADGTAGFSPCCVSAGRVGGGLSAAGSRRRQRDSATNGKQFDQHFPALASHFSSANDVVERYEDVFTCSRAIHEGNRQRVMTPAHFHAIGIGRNEGGGDTVIVLIAYEVVRVGELESEAQHGRYRRERNIAFAPVETDARDCFALPFALAHDARVDQRRCVGAGLRRARRLPGCSTSPDAR